MLNRILDPAEFLSDYGIRSLSKHHQQFPFVFGSGEVRLRAGGIGQQNQGWKFQLARADLVSHHVPDHRSAAEARSGLQNGRSMRSDRRRC